MFCTNCGANVPANSNFCGVCGAKITTPVAAQAADTSNTDAPAWNKPEAVQFADTSSTDAPAWNKPKATQAADARSTDAPAWNKPEAMQFADTSNTNRPAEPKAQTGGQKIDKAFDKAFGDLNLLSPKAAFRRPKTIEEARDQVKGGVSACSLLTILAIFEAFAFSKMFFLPAAIFAALAAGLYFFNSRAAAVIAMTIWVLNVISLFNVIANEHITAQELSGYSWALSIGMFVCSVGLIAAVRGTFALPKLVARCGSPSR